jgi:hypothetical protein
VKGEKERSKGQALKGFADIQKTPYVSLPDHLPAMLYAIDGNVDHSRSR